MIPDHPGREDEDKFLEWVNKVLTVRYGFSPLQNIAIFDGEWATERLSRVKRTNHIAFHPRQPDLPVIVLQGISRYYLLDGNRRINTWIKEKDNGKHAVWLVCPAYEE